MSIFPLDSRDIRLTLDGFPLYGLDDNGCEWHTTFQDVSGLFDGVASTLKTSEKVMTDGWYSNIPVFQGRSITIEGYIIGRCTENCLASWDFLKRTVGGTDMSLTVTLGNVRRQVQVMQSASAPLVKWAGVNMLRFSLSLTSLSPYLFGMDLVSDRTGLPKTVGGMAFPYSFTTAETGSTSRWMWSETAVSGYVRLQNTGTAPSPVLIRVDGPVVNPQITHAGSDHVMAFDISLGSDHYILINGQTHEILVDGTDSARGRVKRREWSQAEIGSNTWGFNASEFSDTARMTVSFYPAYL
jgi:hypothetical protein